MMVTIIPRRSLVLIAGMLVMTMALFGCAGGKAPNQEGASGDSGNAVQHAEASNNAASDVEPITELVQVSAAKLEEYGGVTISIDAFEKTEAPSYSELPVSGGHDNDYQAYRLQASIKNNTDYVVDLKNIVWFGGYSTKDKYGDVETVTGEQVSNNAYDLKRLRGTTICTPGSSSIDEAYSIRPGENRKLEAILKFNGKEAGIFDRTIDSAEIIQANIKPDTTNIEDIDPVRTLANDGVVDVKLLDISALSNGIIIGECTNLTDHYLASVSPRIAVYFPQLNYSMPYSFSETYMISDDEVDDYLNLSHDQHARLGELNDLIESNANGEGIYLAPGKSCKFVELFTWNSVPHVSSAMNDELLGRISRMDTNVDYLDSNVKYDSGKS